MKKILTFALFLTLNLTFMSKAQSNNSENLLTIETKNGKILIELMPDVAPNHVKQIKTLANKGFYDGVVFHRVIDGFMAQTGDPTGTGTGGSDLPDLKAEFSQEPHIRGSVSMARAASPNSANSQFFIVLQDAPHLNNGYTLFGRVTSGMEIVDQIKKGGGNNGIVSNPDQMISVKVGK
jgi:peptidylprolyl isomerase